MTTRTYRLDWTVLVDISALLGAGCIAWGLWQLRTPVAWIWLGGILIVGSVLAVLPEKKKRDEWAAMPEPNNEHLHTIGD